MILYGDQKIYWGIIPFIVINIISYEGKKNLIPPNRSEEKNLHKYVFESFPWVDHVFRTIGSYKDYVMFSIVYHGSRMTLQRGLGAPNILIAFYIDAQIILEKFSSRLDEKFPISKRTGSIPPQIKMGLKCLKTHASFFSSYQYNLLRFLSKASARSCP